MTLEFCLLATSSNPNFFSSRKTLNVSAPMFQDIENWWWFPSSHFLGIICKKVLTLPVIRPHSKVLPKCLWVVFLLT